MHSAAVLVAGAEGQPALEADPVLSDVAASYAGSVDQLLGKAVRKI